MITAHSSAPRWWQQADLTRHWLVFWVVDGPRKIFNLWQTTALDFEAQLAVVTTLRNLGRPLFQDYSREGRIIGFFLRLARVAAGLVIQLIVALVFLAGVVFWLLLPAYLVYQITGNLVGIING